MKKIKLLYSIPNFETAGSGLVLYKILSNINRDTFEPNVVCLHNRGFLYKQIEKLGINIFVKDFCHPSRPILTAIWRAWHYSRFLLRNKYDIVYSYHYAADYTEPIACWFANIPFIFVKKNMGWYGPNLRAWKFRSFLASHIVVQNTDMLTEFYPRATNRKISYIPIGVDLNEFFLLREKQNLNSPVKIIHISSLLPIKGVDIIIDALHYLENNLDFKEYELSIVGNDQTEYVQTLKQEVSKLKLNDRVKFLGYQQNIAELLRESDIFIQSTKNIGRREGAPIALQEAMACGCLVLGGRVSGVKDQLEPFPFLLYESDNFEELANKIYELCNLERSEFLKLRKRITDYVVETYSLDKEIKNHQSLLLKYVQ
jgi:glycosyltransferase involved in cell wall biosynthesis